MVKRLLALLLLPLGLLAQNGRFDNIAYQNNGATGLSVIAGAQISVCPYSITPSTPCSPLVTLYNDRAQQQPITNAGITYQINADVNGNYGSWVPPGAYTIQVASVGASTYTYPLIVTADTSIPIPTFVSFGTNPAQSGFVRLPNTGSVSWRNQAGTLDWGISLNTSDQFNISRTIVTPALISSSGVAPALSGTIRFSNLESIAWRNFAGTTDCALSLSASNVWLFTGCSNVSANNFTGVFTSQSASPAQSGILRLGISDVIRWRNTGGTGDVGFGTSYTTQFGATCSTAASVGATCSTTYSLPSAMPDTSYTPFCTGDNLAGSGTGVAILGAINTKTASQFSISIIAATAVAASLPNVDCLIMHQ